MKRKWIPTIGWTLCYGIFHNCVIVPFFSVPNVDWEYLLMGLGIVLGVSGTRDIGLNKRTKGQINVDNTNDGLE